MNTSATFINTPSAPSLFKGENIVRYPELLSESVNFRIKKIMDDEKLLQDEIKSRKSTYKKYGRVVTLTNGVEYTLILADILVGTLATTIPVVGGTVSSAVFSGIGLISGMAKIIQSKLYEKKLKHYKLSVVAHTTLNNLHHKISKAIVDGEITHEEFEDIQNVIHEWKNKQFTPSKDTNVSPETIELLNQQATEKAQKDILEQLKRFNVKK
jgi:hypothetical protein